MKRIIIIIGFLLLVSSTLVGVASATPPSGATSTTLGRVTRHAQCDRRGVWASLDTRCVRVGIAVLDCDR
jgi:hypothetical protein